MRVALYLRTSHQESSLDNQRGELVRMAAARGWTIINEYVDEGISGAKKRDARPSLDAALKAATQRKFDVLASWSVDRLGRSLTDLLATMDTLKSAGVQMYIHQQALDTSTPAGAAMFGMLGVFAEFERNIIRERILAGMERARAAGKRVGAGKPPIEAGTREKVERLLQDFPPPSIRKIAAATGVSVGMVHKIKTSSGLTF